MNQKFYDIDTTLLLKSERTEQQLAEAEDKDLSEFSDKESAETAWQFLTKVARKAGSNKEIEALSRLARECPNLVDRANGVAAKERVKAIKNLAKVNCIEAKYREERVVTVKSQAKIMRLETSLKEAEAEIEAMRNRYNAIKEDSNRYVASVEAGAESAATRATLAHNLEMGCLKTKVQSLEKRVDEKDALLTRLRGKLFNALLRASSADDHAHELIRAKHEIARYEQHCRRMSELYGARSVVRTKEIPCIAATDDVIDEVAVPVVGELEAIKARVRAKKAAVQDDDVTVVAEKRPLAAAIKRRLAGGGAGAERPTAVLELGEPAAAEEDVIEVDREATTESDSDGDTIVAQSGDMIIVAKRSAD